MAASMVPISPNGRDRGPEGPPWTDPALPSRAAFAALWVTGPDPALDGAFRLLGLRRSPSGEGWERLDRFAAPFPESGSEAATARMRREFGVTGEDLAGAPPAAEIWPEVRRFLGEGPVIVPCASVFRAWRDHLTGRPERSPAILGLDELTWLLFPGRRARRGELAAWEWLEPGERPASAAALEPEGLRRATIAAIGAFLERDPEAIEVAALGFFAAWAGLHREGQAEVASWLALALSLVEHPSAWAGREEGLFDLHPALRDGALGELSSDRSAGEAAEALGVLLDELQPAWQRGRGPWLSTQPVPTRSEEPAPFHSDDRRTVDDVFQVHLPTLFADGGASSAPSYREGQHRVAARVAGTLGERELLVVHAPTGTGKTLAYLVPAMLWASRYGVRVGVSTYTRALQEQAVDRDLPLARRALGRTDASAEPARVSLLKGRENYLCWRTLCLNLPGPEDGPEAWLAWTLLALFALTDETGDLDRFPLRPPVPLAPTSDSRLPREIGGLARLTRAWSGCCTHKRDRESCAAENARWRAERSHVVVTNHAFTLLRPEFFRNVIFDECEHLHDQAESAWSASVGLRGARRLLERLRDPGRPTSGAPLDRLARLVVEGSAAAAALAEAIGAQESALAGIARLAMEVDDFLDWREEARRERTRSDEHSLLREYLGGQQAEGLHTAHERLVASLEDLLSALARLAEHLDEVPARGMRRLRRALELMRGDVEELSQGLESWIPRVDGRAEFLPDVFYDVEEGVRGEKALVARLLLPNEHLGRRYHPALESAVFISATTCLRGGFDASLGYLGLDRAAQPLPDEDREPSLVSTLRAPSPFDHGRVLVCVPHDAPRYQPGRGDFQEYVRRFVAHLGERTRGRMLVLFTNAREVTRTGQELAGFFRARSIPFWFQNMEGSRKEELSERFRARADSILLGVDTFWFGADFPGETLEYLVIVKLPYGVPDRYHHAQSAALGPGDQRHRIYMPRALAKFRQGFGRLMRRESDRGVVFVLDRRILQGAGRVFLGELPLAERGEESEWEAGGSRLVVAPTDECLHEALTHMNMLADVRRRGLDLPFEGGERRPT